jgi:hypothetical protein
VGGDVGLGQAELTAAGDQLGDQLAASLGYLAEAREDGLLGPPPWGSHIGDDISLER